METAICEASAPRDTRLEEVNGVQIEADGANSLAHARTRELKPWHRLFLDSLKKLPNIGSACRAANVSRVTAYKHREDNEAFREAWDELLEDHTDTVEESLHEVATEGHKRVHVTKAGTVVEERVKDVNAMKFWLSGNRPKTYRETHGPLVNIQLPTVEEALGAFLTGPAADFARKLTAPQADTRETH